MQVTEKMTAFKAGLASVMAFSLLGMMSGAFAQRSDLDRLMTKPIVKQAAVGAAIGVGAGVLSDRASVGKGALAGALSGAGTGAVSQSRYFNDKPLLRNAAKGAIIGTGTSYATGSSKLKGAAIGAGAGAGYHYIRKYLDER